ncbi:MAG: stage III sporulation protein AA [Bacillota bacterium]
MSFEQNVLTTNLIGEISGAVLKSPDFVWSEIEEIRMRTGRAVYVRCHGREYVLQRNGNPLVLDKTMIDRSVMVLSKSSFYAFEEEMKQGFITVKGGHRIGLCGETVLENGAIKTLKNISGINFRIAREVTGSAEKLLEYIWDGRSIRQCLIAAPPAVGKTTVLRDLARIFGDGDGVPAVNVGIADERCEIAGSFLGVPQMNIGSRTDVISGCLKADGIMMLIRSMSPQLILTDEIGGQKDAAALMDAMNCGVRIIATAHGACYEELIKRPVIRDLLICGFFERVIFIGRDRRGVYAKAVVDGNGEKLC